MTDKQMQDLEKLGIPEQNIYRNEPMSKHTTFKIGGPAECYVIVKQIEQVKTMIQYAQENHIPINIVGNGSNLLVSDKGIKGIVLKVDIDKIEIQTRLDENVVILTVGTGVKLGKLAQVLLKKEISGVEELAGIPGTIGGAVTMNAGAYGKEMKDIITKVKCIDFQGNRKELTKEELQFEYRKSIFKKEKYVILEVEMALHKGERSQIKEKMAQYMKARREKQPLEYPNAGSTFKRGEDFITAQLIDKAGLKGYSIGGAMVSTKHAGFIVNKGNATCEDILTLVQYIKEDISKKFNKEIELEIETMGELKNEGINAVV